MAPGPTDIASVALRLLAATAERAPLETLAALSPEFDLATVEWLRGRKIDALAYLAMRSPPPTQSVYDAIWQVQRQALDEVVTALTSASTPVAVIKGAECLGAYYGGRAIGRLLDIDLLVRRDALQATRDVMRQLGFCHAYLDGDTGALVARSDADIAAFEREHYELAPFVRLATVPLDTVPLDDDVIRSVATDGAGLAANGEELVVELAFDVHHGLATNIDGEPILSRAAPSAFDGALALTPADHIWFTTARFYTEVALAGKRSLRDFAYVLPALGRGGVDWDVVLEADRRFSLGPALHYYFRFMNWLHADLIPSEVIELTSPLRSLRSRDWGWQLGPLFGWIDPPPYEDGQPTIRRPHG